MTKSKITAATPPSSPPTPRERELEKKIDSLSRELELSELRESKLWLQLRSAVEAKVNVAGLDPGELWTAATLVKSGKCTTSSFSNLASRWALGLPIDIDSLRGSGIVDSLGEPEATPLHKSRERRRARARDKGREELAIFFIPLLESLWDESLRIEKETEAPGDPGEVLEKIYDRVKRFTAALGAVQDVLLAEIPEEHTEEQ
jgi:hypothetical protein